MHVLPGKKLQEHAARRVTFMYGNADCRTAARTRPRLFFLTAATLCLLLPSVCGARTGIFVSILPEKNFVEKVGGAQVDVSVLVPPGRSPETYEPTPRQMAGLADSALYFRMGVPFEERWIDRMGRLNPRLKIVDLRVGIELRGMEEAGEGPGAPVREHAQDASEADPHIWMNPRLVSRMAVTIRDALSEHDPDRRDVYRANCDRFIEELEQVDREIRLRLGRVRLRDIYVYHPALGYFAEAYGLRQVAIERSGREPGPRTLQGLVEQARRDGVRALLVDNRQSSRNAEAIAGAMGARVVSFDPLAENYVENLRSLTAVMEEVLR